MYRALFESQPLGDYMYRALFESQPFSRSNRSTFLRAVQYLHFLFISDPQQISQQVFMVRLSKGVSPGPNQRIIYDNVLVNLANNYDPRHGTFTTKINGTYLFTLECCSAPPHYIHLSLQKNSTEMGTVLCGDDAYHDCSSNTFMFPLAVGDDVWVQHRGTVGDLIDITYGNNFAGVLLHPT